MKKFLLKSLSLILVVCLAVFSFSACEKETGLVFEEIAGSGNIAVAGYTGTDTKVVIPDKFRGKPVVSILDNAFKENANITEVLIGKQVVSIGEFAFNNCKALKKVELPDGIMDVGMSSFMGCDALEYNADGQLKYLGNSNNPYILLVSCEKTATDVTVNEDCKVVGIAAFENCTGLESVKLSKRLNFISGYAFVGTNIKKLDYYGTEEDWNKITLDENWLTNSKVVCINAYGATIDVAD